MAGPVVPAPNVARPVVASSPRRPDDAAEVHAHDRPIRREDGHAADDARSRRRTGRAPIRSLARGRAGRGRRRRRSGGRLRPERRRGARSAGRSSRGGSARGHAGRDRPDRWTVPWSGRVGTAAPPRRSRRALRPAAACRDRPAGQQVLRMRAQPGRYRLGRPTRSSGVVSVIRTAARGWPATWGREAGIDARPGGRPPVGRWREPRTGQELAEGRAEVAAQRVADSGKAVDLVGFRRLAAPAPQHRPKLRHGREAHPVVHAVHVRSPLDGKDVTTLAVRVVDDRIECRHPPEARVVLDHHRDDVHRRDRPPRTPGPSPRRRGRRAARWAGRCPSRSPRRRAMPPPRAG